MVKSKDKKKDDGLSDVEQSAKLNVVKSIRDKAAKEMADRVGSIKKVTVASNDSEGLKHGLEKAKELVGASKDEESDEDPVEEALESPEEEAKEEAEEPSDEEAPSGDDFKDLSEEELDKKIQELLALKEKLKHSEE